MLESSYGYAGGGGGGFGYALSRSVNLDAGVAAVLQGFGNTTTKTSSREYAFNPFLGFAAKLGLSVGF